MYLLLTRDNTTQITHLKKAYKEEREVLQYQ